MKIDKLKPIYCPDTEECEYNAVMFSEKINELIETINKLYLVLEDKSEAYKRLIGFKE